MNTVLEYIFFGYNWIFETLGYHYDNYEYHYGDYFSTQVALTFIVGDSAVHVLSINNILPELRAVDWRRFHLLNDILSLTASHYPSNALPDNLYRARAEVQEYLDLIKRFGLRYQYMNYKTGVVSIDFQDLYRWHSLNDSLPFSLNRAYSYGMYTEHHMISAQYVRGDYVFFDVDWSDLDSNYYSDTDSN